MISTELNIQMNCTYSLFIISDELQTFLEMMCLIGKERKKRENKFSRFCSSIFIYLFRAEL